MIHSEIVNALTTLRPGALWDLSGDTLAGITWLDGNQTQPTNDEITAAIAAYVPPPTLQDQIVALQTQVATLLAAQGE